MTFKFKLISFLAFLLLGVSFFYHCSDNQSFQYSQLHDAALNTPEGTTTNVVDTNHDGVADGFDNNGVVTEFGNDDGSSGGSGGNPPPVRGINCVVPGATKLFHTKTATIHFADLGTNTSIWVATKGSSETITLDMQNHNIQRVIVTLTGSSNTVVLKNVHSMTSVCVDKEAGSRNDLEIEDTVALADVDLDFRGGHNLANIKTLPSHGLAYVAAGASDCVSYLTGTTILSSDSSGQGAIVHADGTLCE